MLITPEESSRIDRIAKGRNDDPDVLWLCGIATRLARLKSTEADFPEHSVLIDRQKRLGFELKLQGGFTVDQTTMLVGPIEKAMLLDYTVKCDVVEAFFLVRPYVKLISPVSEEVLERLGRFGRIRMTVSGKAQPAEKGVHVVNDAPLDDVLVGLDGYGVKRKPFEIRTTSPDMYGVGVLDAKQQAFPRETGIFVCNEDRIFLDIGFTNPDAIRRGEEVTLVAGLVMGRYTTRGIPDVAVSVFQR